MAPLISHFKRAERHGSSSKVTRRADLENYFYLDFFFRSLPGFSIDKGIP